MSKAKAKGTYAENGVVDFLIENGFPYAERRALNGAFDLGDITGTPALAWEVKNQKTYKISAWLKETEQERQNARADFGILVVKPNGVGIANAKDWWAILTLEQITNLLRDAGYGSSR